MIRGAVVGCGYFAPFHLEAWSKMEEVEIVGVADIDAALASRIGLQWGVKPFADAVTMLDEAKPDFVDIITPPSTHHKLVLAAAARGIHVICQKPLAANGDLARSLVEAVQREDVRFMVHENWRWQPWYRAAKRLIDEGTTGRPHHLSFSMRTGDGWQSDAYVARQPYFRSYERFLLHETGVHFFDTFRYLLGDVASVYARTSRRNPDIVGEDTAVVMLEFCSGASAVLDASRYNEFDAADQRYTFGSMRLDTESGHLEMNGEGQLRWKALGTPMETILSDPPRSGFGGESVLALQRHFVRQLENGEPFESEGHDYLKSIDVVEACYRSAAENRAIELDH